MTLYDLQPAQMSRIIRHKVLQVTKICHVRYVPEDRPLSLLGFKLNQRHLLTDTRDSARERFTLLEVFKE